MGFIRFVFYVVFSGREYGDRGVVGVMFLGSGEGFFKFF